MQLKNSSSRYGLIAIVLHWVMALIVFGLFGLGLYMVELTYYDTWYRGSLELHKSIGMSLLLLWMGRVAWKRFNSEPKAVDPSAKFVNVSAKLVHGLLYILMLVLMVSGYLISTADGRGIEIFGLFNVPAIPFAIDNQEDIAGQIHEVLAWIIAGLATVHGLAALQHHFINKDSTLMRMLPSRNAQA